MIHSVFELGDTIVREVMVPRTDVVFIERNKTLRQAMSLALRSGFSRIPVIGENLDDIVGVRLPQGRHQAGLRPARGGVHRAGRVRDAPGDVRPRLQAGRRAAARDAGRAQARRGRRRRVRRHRRPGHHRGRAGGDRRRDHRRVRRGARSTSSGSPTAPSGSARASRSTTSSEVCGIAIEDDDVDTVGGLMAKHLGRVPIAGSVVEAHGLRFEAEAPDGPPQPDRHGADRRRPSPSTSPRTPSPTLTPMPTELTDPEDAKIVTLARSTRARTACGRGRLRARPRRPHLRRAPPSTFRRCSCPRSRWRWRWRSPARRAGSRRWRCSARRPAWTTPTWPSYATSPGAGVTVYVAAPDGSVVASLTS